MITKNRMEAFSDGVLAIVITVMVLKLNVPSEISLKGIEDILPTLVAYVVSYLYIGIYWANHHHLVNTSYSVSGSILWRNLHWLFWMSLLPITTEWMGLNPFVGLPTLCYGVTLLMCAISYNLLQAAIVKSNGMDSPLAKTLGKDWKGKLSILFYAIGVFVSLSFPVVAYLIYAAIALLWIIPDIRLERILKS